MNATETAYSVVLDAMQQSGEIGQWWFEPMSFRLSSPPSGQPARYTPDFMILRSCGEVWIIDVKASKGFDDKASVVRVKAAAELFPLFRFFVAYKRPKKSGGGFELIEV